MISVQIHHNKLEVPLPSLHYVIRTNKTGLRKGGELICVQGSNISVGTYFLEKIVSRENKNVQAYVNWFSTAMVCPSNNKVKLKVHISRSMLHTK